MPPINLNVITTIRYKFEVVNRLNEPTLCGHIQKYLKILLLFLEYLFKD